MKSIIASVMACMVVSQPIFNAIRNNDMKQIEEI
jgi:hypothetical protein